VSQLDVTLSCIEYATEFICFVEDDHFMWAEISTAKTKKTAYERAARKLRKLADEAYKLAEES